MRRSLAIAVALATASPALADVAAPYGKTQGLIPGVLVGPKLNVIALPPGFGLELKTFGNALGLSFDLGIVPTTTISGTRASWADLGVGARYFPWSARFFLGGRLGTRSFSASATDSAGLKAKADVSGVYLAPEIGWSFVWSGGFFMGLECGYQIMLSNKITLDLPAGVDPSKQKDVQDAADHIGKIGLPVLTLLQVGYFF